MKIFFPTSAVLSFVAEFACFTLSVNSLNSGVVIYLLWSGILISMVLRAAVAAINKLVIRDTSSFTLFILLLRVVLIAKLEILGILSSISLILAL